MVCWGTLISVSGYCLHWPQKGQKGHMTLESWDISCNNATFLFLNSCVFVMLLSVSTVILCNKLTYEPTHVSSWFFLFTAEREWSVHQIVTVCCVEYQTTQNTHASYQSNDNKTLLDPQNLCSGIKRGNWEQCGQDYFGTIVFPF